MWLPACSYHENRGVVRGGHRPVTGAFLIDIFGTGEDAAVPLAEERRRERPPVQLLLSGCVRHGELMGSAALDASSRAAKLVLEVTRGDTAGGLVFQAPPCRTPWRRRAPWTVRLAPVG